MIFFGNSYLKLTAAAQLLLVAYLPIGKKCMGIRPVIKYKKASPKIDMKISELLLSLSKKNLLK